MNNEKKKPSKFKRAAAYLIGSAVVAGVAIAIVPDAMKKLTNASYKNKIKRELEQKDDDDWGPEITKKQGDEDGN